MLAFIDLKNCFHLKHFVYFTSTAAKNMIRSYSYGYNFIPKHTGRKAALENLIRVLIKDWVLDEKCALQPYRLYLHFPQKFAWVLKTCFL